MGTTGGRVLTNVGVGVQITPSTNNVNTVTGTPLPTNSYLNTIPTAGPQTMIYVPGYPGAFSSLEAADTLETIGDDGTRCYVADSPVQYQGSARLLVLCWSVTGVPVLHRVHGGTWQY
jgi:hypothetical protein